MKYITLIIGLLVVGCGKTDDAPNGNERKLTAEDVVGSYEKKFEGGSIKYVIRENGRMYYHTHHQREAFFWAEWKIDGKEVVFSDMVHKIEPNGDLTVIAIIEDGKREGILKENQTTFKKLK
jgi:hypothetical protein